jgi:hypothetical protein
MHFGIVFRCTRVFSPPVQALEIQLRVGVGEAMVRGLEVLQYESAGSPQFSLRVIGKTLPRYEGRIDGAHAARRLVVRVWYRRRGLGAVLDGSFGLWSLGRRQVESKLPDHLIGAPVFVVDTGIGMQGGDKAWSRWYSNSTSELRAVHGGPDNAIVLRNAA